MNGISADQAKLTYIDLAVSLGFNASDPSKSTHTEGKGGGDMMGPVQSTMTHEMGENERADFQGDEALFQAASEGDIDKLKNLLGEQGSINNKQVLNCQDENGQTALQWACDRGQTGAVKLLLSYPELQVNLADQSGMSALHYAVTCEYEELVKLLLSAGISFIPLIRIMKPHRMVNSVHR